MKEKIIRTQIDILKSLDLLETQFEESFKPFIEYIVPNNTNIFDARRDVFKTIEDLSNKEFRDWIEWYVYDTDFGTKNLIFSIDDVEYEPTLDNIMEFIFRRDCENI